MGSETPFPVPLKQISEVKPLEHKDSKPFGAKVHSSRIVMFIGFVPLWCVIHVQDLWEVPVVFHQHIMFVPTRHSIHCLAKSRNKRIMI